MSIMLNMQFPANVRVFQECTLLAVLIDSLGSSSSFLQMQFVRLIHPLVLLVPRTMRLQARTGWLLDTLPSEHSRRKPSWKKTSVRMFHCFTGFLDSPPAARPAACRKLWSAWSEKARRHGGLMRTEKKKAMKNELFHELFHALPILSWALGTTSFLFVCACVSGLFQFGCLHTCTILYNICVLYLCMHINIICYVMYVIFLRQQRHLLGSFLFVSASLVALEASKSSCSRETPMIWATNIHLRHRLKAVAIRRYTRNFNDFSLFLIPKSLSTDSTDSTVHCSPDLPWLSFGFRQVIARWGRLSCSSRVRCCLRQALVNKRKCTTKHLNFHLLRDHFLV